VWVCVGVEVRVGVLGGFVLRYLNSTKGKAVHCEQVVVAGGSGSGCRCGCGCGCGW
jgi:hypothetical protein